MNDQVDILTYDIDDVRNELRRFAQYEGITAEEALMDFVKEKTYLGFSFPDPDENKSFYDSLIE